jgi:hypothetical protein
MQDDRPLPSALDSEAVLLSTCLKGNGALTAALDAGLVPGDLCNSDDQTIFKTLCDMKERGTPVDRVLLSEELRQQGWSKERTIDALFSFDDDAGGVAPCVPENIPIHAKKIKAAAQRRRIIEAGHAAAEKAFNEEIPVDAIENTLRDFLTPSLSSKLPAIVWGAQYIENGIPDRKPELISGILRRSHKMLIGAPSKACKSYLAIRLALAIAQGRDWLAYPCTAGKVYIANFEIDEGSYVHRVKAVADTLGWPMPDNIAFHHLRGYGSEIETLFPAISQAIEGQDFSAVILDPQYKLLRSKEIRNFSENDAAAMSYLYGELDRHFSRQGISTVIISHFAKGMAAGKESIDRIAGSGAPMRDVDAICTLTALDSDDSYRMEFSLREFKTPEPLSLHWEHPIHTVDPMLDGVALKSRPGRPGVAKSADDSIVLQTIKGLNDGTATQSAVRTALQGNMGKDRVINALERLRISGKLTTSTGEKNAILYHAV